MTPELEDLCNRIADHWGGTQCKRFWVTEGERFGFMGDEGFSRYTVTLPGTKSPCFEDSGRPAGWVMCPANKVIVRCLDDAPDAWWHVNFDGSYNIYGREGTV
jgi:hypothetical protein